jgi:hypothetical protein
MNIYEAESLLKEGKIGKFLRYEQNPYSDDSYYGDVPEDIALKLNEHPWNHIKKQENGLYEVNLSFRIGD